MRTLIWIPLIMGCSLCFAFNNAKSQQFKDHIIRQFTLKKTPLLSMLAIYNMNGSVRVEGYSGDKVNIEIEETITAKNQEALIAAKKEVKIEFVQSSDSIISYIAEPFDTRPHKNRKHYHDDIEINYQLKLNFIVKVPYNINLTASTVNDGNINIQHVIGTLTVNNVNGAITISHAQGTTDAHTINGNLTVDYLAVPSGSSSYYTLNGELRVSFPASLSADLHFKSMNGKFFTDFNNAQILPAHIEKTKEKQDSETIFKLQKDTELRIGIGGRVLKFETLNGNIYIKKQS